LLARAVGDLREACPENDGPGGRPYHRRFRVSLSLCPNACSRPQIADFGVIGAALPRVTGNTCTGCNVCIGVCREGAISPRFGVPVIDYSRCVSCGECARACPCGSVEIYSGGFRVLVGGRLGRHPRLARELGRLYSAEETVRLFVRSAGLFFEHYGEGRRFAELLDRYDLAEEGLLISRRDRFSGVSG
jgi:dissimilatory sulfite reductase (desulfoviridin) alpha/beta subunit